MSNRLWVSMAILGIWMIAVPASGKSRNTGGSCVYDRKGQLVHAPKGEECPTREEAPGTNLPNASAEFAGLPPDLRVEANALVGGYSHVVRHLTELRRAVGVKDQTRSIELTDEITKELVEHLAREESLFNKLGTEHQSH